MMGIFSLLVSTYICTYICYTKLLLTCYGNEKIERDAGEDETPCVRMLIPRSIVSLLCVCSHGGNIRLLVPWGPGLLCKMSEHLMAFTFCVYFRSGTRQSSLMGTPLPIGHQDQYS